VSSPVCVVRAVCAGPGGLPVDIFTGSIARSATCRYLIYSEADFDVFLPAGATRCTDWGEIWEGGGDRSLHSLYLISGCVRC